MKMNVPNTLTIIRVLLIPFFVAFMLCNITAYDNYVNRSGNLHRGKSYRYPGRISGEKK